MKRPHETTAWHNAAHTLATMAPVIVRFVDDAHVLMSDGWVVRGAYIPTPDPAALL